VPSVVSDNFTGARDLTRVILSHVQQDFGALSPLHFIGGRAQDHNTRERLRGFLAAHEELGLPVPDENRMMRGYSADKTAAAMADLRIADGSGIFVNSTIALEGVVRWLHEQPMTPRVRFGCFDWDPFAAFLPQNVGMMQQDVAAMLARTFELIDTPPEGAPRIEIPCRFRARG